MHTCACTCACACKSTHDTVCAPKIPAKVKRRVVKFGQELRRGTVVRMTHWGLATGSFVFSCVFETLPRGKSNDDTDDEEKRNK